MPAAAHGYGDRVSDRGAREELRDLLANRIRSREDLRDLIQDRLQQREALRDLIGDRLRGREDLRDLLADAPAAATICGTFWRNAWKDVANRAISSRIVCRNAKPFAIFWRIAPVAVAILGTAGEARPIP